MHVEKREVGEALKMAVNFFYTAMASNIAVLEVTYFTISFSR